jgi:hypothetical protein
MAPPLSCPGAGLRTSLQRAAATGRIVFASRERKEIA